MNWLIGLFVAYLIVGFTIHCFTSDEDTADWDLKNVFKFCLTWGIKYWNSYKEDKNENKGENNDKEGEEEAK